MSDNAIVAPAGAARRMTGTLLKLTDTIAAGLLAADLAVVIYSVLARSLFNAPVEWADDVARGLMVASSFFGAASALARGENPGVEFFRSALPESWQRVVDDVGAALVLVVAAYVAFHAIELGWITAGQTTGSGLPLELTFYPMGLGAACMTVFAAEILFERDWRHVLRAVAILATVGCVFLLGDAFIPDAMPSSGALMLAGFALTLAGGLPIGFALALAALIFIWAEGTLPGVIFAQQMARGIDNFVLLAIPFFILVGYLMEANGMSVRLIELLQRLVGRMRGGLNVVMVTAMVLFSGISGSKMADVAAVGAVLVPASRKSGQNPGSTVALLAASAVMAETIPPCINLIILGFVANLSIGGLFAAGLLPAGADGRGPHRRIGSVRQALDGACACPAGSRRDAADVARRRRFARADRDDLHRLQIGLCDRNRDFRLRLTLRDRGGSFGVSRTDGGQRLAQLRPGGGALRPRAVHRRGRAIARLRIDVTAGAACGRRVHGGIVA